MFGKDKDKEQDFPVVTSKPVSKDSKTILAEGCRIVGNLFVVTSTRIDGEVKGDIKGDSSVTVGSSGKIEGNINIPDAVVYGTVKGNIKAERVELKRGSVVNGNLKVNNITTEYGSAFNGKCTMKGNEPETNDYTDEKESEETSDVKVKRTIKQTAEKN